MKKMDKRKKKRPWDMNQTLQMRQKTKTLHLPKQSLRLRQHRHLPPEHVKRKIPRRDLARAGLSLLVVLVLERSLSLSVCLGVAIEAGAAGRVSDLLRRPYL